jgi:hypothetical protein
MLSARITIPHEYVLRTHSRSYASSQLIPFGGGGRHAKVVLSVPASTSSQTPGGGRRWRCPTIIGAQ